MNTEKLDIRVYPLDAPKGDTLAYASAAIGGMVVIRGMRVVSGRNGRFVSMPQSRDRDGNFHDVAFPTDASLRRALTDGILSAYEEVAGEGSPGFGMRLSERMDEAMLRSISEWQNPAAGRISATDENPVAGCVPAAED